MKRSYNAKLMQDGMVVASVSAPTFEQAQREIMHYAMMYGQDGPVVVKLPRRIALPADKHDFPSRSSH